MSQNTIPPTKQALEEAFGLSEAILKSIELSEMPLANIALKTVRLARLLNDFGTQRMMQFEVSGYPNTPNGIDLEVFNLARIAGRTYHLKDEKTKKLSEYAYTESIEQLEYEVNIAEHALNAAKDNSISISSANPHQFVSPPIGNITERSNIRQQANNATKRLSSRRTLIYQYALSKHYELKFSGIADDIFSRVRERADSTIGKILPESVNKLAAVYENLRSENTEDWSNAVHTCRRLLQDLADKIYPVRENRTKEQGGKTITIKLGVDNYKNRIVAFIEENTESKRFSGVVGSHLGFLGDRLDNIFEAAQKGSHNVIVSQEEADRYVIYTYLIVGDVLSLINPSPN